MKFKQHTLILLGGEIVVGNPGKGEDPDRYFFPYRSSSVITDFFHEIETEYTHDGSTRHRWAAAVLEKILQEPQAGENFPPNTFARLIPRLMDPDDGSSPQPNTAAVTGTGLWIGRTDSKWSTGTGSSRTTTICTGTESSDSSLPRMLM